MLAESLLRRSLPRRHDLDELIRCLLLIGDPRQHPDLVDEVILQLQPSWSELKRHTRFAPGRYTRNLLFRNDEFELLLNCWDRQARSPIHGHGGELCWFAPLVGSFELRDYRLVEGGLSPGHAVLEMERFRREVGPGEIDRRDEDHDVHLVSVAQGEGHAISLHLYARPVDECLVYDLARSTCFLRSLRYDQLPASFPTSLAALRARHAASALAPRRIAQALSSRLGGIGRRSGLTARPRSL